MCYVIKNEPTRLTVSYLPTQADIEWTNNAITGRVVWAVPSVGCVLLIHHETKNWTTYMKSNPTDQETVNYEEIETNLNILGYHEATAKIIGEAKNVNDVLFILRAMVGKAKQERGLDEFWTRVDNSICSFLENLGL